MLWLERRRLATLVPRLIRPIPRIDLDVRSLALFRILLGTYLVVETLYARASYGRYDLAWYTSDDENAVTIRSYLHATDTPHTSPLHQLWFYRGTVHVQGALFAATALTAALAALGWLGRVGKVLLFVLVTAQQNRNMHVHDGSDNYCRHLLLWSCFLPLEHTWRATGWCAMQTKQTPQQRDTQTQKQTPQLVETTVVATLPAYALALQIVLMYSGTVWARTWDLYPTFQQLWTHCDWLPRQMSAIHYALSSAFAVRDQVWFTDVIRRYPWVGHGATVSGLAVEAVCPVLCYGTGPRHRLYFALPLVALHVTLLVQMRLPQWQYLALVSHTIWIPTHAWDQLYRVSHGWHCLVSKAAMRPKDDTNDTTIRPVQHVYRRWPNRSGRLSKSLQAFFLCYMVYNFAGERKWIAKHDHGDIGEGLRLSQYWVMYATAPKTAHTVRLTGLVPTTTKERRIDLLHFISSRGDVRTDETSITVVHLDMSRRYPSARWERALNEWASRSYTQPDYGRTRARHFAHALCTLVNDDLYARRLESLRAIEVVFQHSMVNPPGSPERYAAQRAAVDTVVTVPCQPRPSLRPAVSPQVT